MKPDDLMRISESLLGYISHTPEWRDWLNNAYLGVRNPSPFSEQERQKEIIWRFGADCRSLSKEQIEILLPDVRAVLEEILLFYEDRLPSADTAVNRLKLNMNIMEIKNFLKTKD